MDIQKEAKTRILTEREEVRRIIEEAALRGSALHVEIKGEPRLYHSAFETRDEEQLREIRQGRAILMAPLDPPLGNMKIRFAPEVVLRFALYDYAVEMDVPMEGILANRTLRLGFPRSLRLAPQQRHNPRVPVVPELPVEMVIWSEDGQAVPGRVHDVSRGGVAFSALEGAGAFQVGEKLRLTMLVQSVTILELHAEVLGTKTVDGKDSFRAMFHYHSGRERSIQEHLICRMEQEMKRRREVLFGESPVEEYDAGVHVG